MLFLRRFSGAASSRLSTRVIRPSITALPSIASTIRASFAPSISRTAAVNFSVSRTRFDEHSQYLVAKLAKEIELETEETAAGSGSEAGVKQFFDEVPGWEVTDLEGEQDVLFTRKYEDEEITVHFNIADFNSVLPSEEHGMEDDVLADEEDMDLQSGGANTKGSSVQGRTSGGNYKVAPEDSEDAAAREESYDEDDTPPAFPVNVTVLIHRPASSDKGSLRFDLVSDNGEFNIQQITPLASSSASALEQVRESYSDRQTRYAGPPFEQLDESVQETFEEYLNARGITSQLANVIPDYIDVKEQKEYLAWLNRVRSFAE